MGRDPMGQESMGRLRPERTLKERLESRLESLVKTASDDVGTLGPEFDLFNPDGCCLDRSC